MRHIHCFKQSRAIEQKDTYKNRDKKKSTRKTRKKHIQQHTYQHKNHNTPTIKETIKRKLSKRQPRQQNLQNTQTSITIKIAHQYRKNFQTYTYFTESTTIQKKKYRNQSLRHRMIPTILPKLIRTNR